MLLSFSPSCLASRILRLLSSLLVPLRRNPTPSYTFSRTFCIHSVSTSMEILPRGQTVPAECMDQNTVCVLYIFSDQSVSYH
ncbi:hypothetical protein BDR04DRAFT_1095061 [Suillus decipiens]|nr:hypothetical protein BDR04DRAFT_1095061 [Suillus decipiens]